jgi:predicted nucleic acid-binding protein
MTADLVVDSGVAVKWVSPEPLSDKARLILDDFQAGQLTLHAPDLLTSETGNVIWKKHVFQGVAAVDALLMLDTLRNIPITIHAGGPLLSTAYHLAVTHRRTVYDMLYVALSLELGSRFVTADDRLYNAINATFPNIVRLADWS